MLELLITLFGFIILAMGLVGGVIFCTVTRMNILDEDGNYLVKK